MSDLAAWLLEQIAADETDAQQWQVDVERHWRERSDWSPCGCQGCITLTMLDAEEADGQTVIVHPARVLAECAAKRAIVELHRWTRDEQVSQGDPICRTCGEPIVPGYEQGVQAWPCPTLLALAQPYAGRDGWRDEWAS